MEGENLKKNGQYSQYPAREPLNGLLVAHNMKSISMGNCCNFLRWPSNKIIEGNIQEGSGFCFILHHTYEVTLNRWPDSNTPLKVIPKLGTPLNQDCYGIVMQFKELMSEENRQVRKDTLRKKRAKMTLLESNFENRLFSP